MGREPSPWGDGARAGFTVIGLPRHMYSGLAPLGLIPICADDELADCIYLSLSVGSQGLSLAAPIVHIPLPVSDRSPLDSETFATTG